MIYMLENELVQYTYFYCANLLIFSASAQEYEFFDAHERCSKGTGEYLMPIGLIRHLEVNISKLPTQKYLGNLSQ